MGRAPGLAVQGLLPSQGPIPWAENMLGAQEFSGKRWGRGLSPEVAGASGALGHLMTMSVTPGPQLLGTCPVVLVQPDGGGLADPPEGGSVSLATSISPLSSGVPLSGDVFKNRLNLACEGHSRTPKCLQGLSRAYVSLVTSCSDLLLWLNYPTRHPPCHLCPHIDLVWRAPCSP